MSFKMSEIVGWLVLMPYTGITQSCVYERDGKRIVAYSGGLSVEEYQARFELERGKTLTFIPDSEWEALEAQYMESQKKITECTQEHFHEMLNVLPPMKYNGTSFCMSEGLRGTLHSWFVQMNGRYCEVIESALNSNDFIEAKAQAFFQGA